MHVTAVLALGAVYLAWGGTYPAIRVMVETAPPLVGTGVRFLIAGALLGLFVAFWPGRPRRRPTREELLGSALVGTVILGDIGLLALAEQEVPAGLAALLIASVPLWVVLLRLAARERIPPGAAFGLVVGFGGVALLIAPGANAEAPIGWLLLLVVAAAIEAAGQFGSRWATQPADALAATVVQLLAAGIVLSVAGLLAGEGSEIDPSGWSLDSLLAFAYLVIPGSVIAYSAFVWLLDNEPISLVSTYAYVNPVVAVLAGWLLLSEEITVRIAIGATAILLSVAFVIRSERRPVAAAAQSSS
jgi:drug/metabolite transporter (DMT)-like permease